jgi:hypothetical protein
MSYRTTQFKSMSLATCYAVVVISARTLQTSFDLTVGWNTFYPVTPKQLPPCETSHDTISFSHDQML